MGKYLRAVGFFIVIVVIAVGSCFLTFSILETRKGKDEIDTHGWLHEQLNISDETDAKLLAIEATFKEKEDRLKEELARANFKLSRVLLEEKSYTENVQSVVREIHRIQGDLQNATIEHFFNMQTVLDAAQKEKLLRLAAESLVESEE